MLGLKRRLLGDWPYCYRRLNDDLQRTVDDVNERIRNRYGPRKDPLYIMNRKPVEIDLDGMDFKYTLVKEPKYLSGRNKMAKRGAYLKKLDYAIITLLQGFSLPKEFKPRKLHGNMKGEWECRIKDGRMGDDWILIYAYSVNELVLHAVDAGTHREISG